MKAQVISLNEYRKTNNYDRAFNYAIRNWKTLSKNATVYFGMNYQKVPSIADQIMRGTGCPYNVAEEIANSISISLAVGLTRLDK